MVPCLLDVLLGIVRTSERSFMDASFGAGLAAAHEPVISTTLGAEDELVFLAT